MLVGFADVTAVEDEAIVDVFPILFRDEAFEIVGNFFKIGVVGEVEFAGESLYMRVGRDAFPDFVQFAEDDVRGFVANAGEFLEFFCRAGEVAAKIVCDDFRGSNDMLRLIPEKRSARNLPSEFGEVRRRKIFRRFVFFKKFLCHSIHQFIRALRREHDCNNKLERC